MDTETSEKPLDNQRWEAFAIAYVRLCGDASAAYREVYPHALKWNDDSVWTRASRLLGNAKVLPRVKALQARVSAEGVAGADEVAKFLTKVLRSDESMASPLVDRKGAAVTDPRTEKPLLLGVPLRLRIVAADKLNRMLGYNKPLKVEVEDSGRGSPGEEVKGALDERVKGIVKRFPDEAEGVAP